MPENGLTNMDVQTIVRLEGKVCGELLQPTILKYNGWGAPDHVSKPIEVVENHRHLLLAERCLYKGMSVLLR